MSEWAVLSDFCNLITSQIDPVSLSPDHSYLGLEHLASGRMTPISFGNASEVQSHKFAFRNGDVLFSKLRPYLDKSILADRDGVCTTELLVLRPNPGVDPRFLACVMHDPAFIKYAMVGVTGAHHPRTSWAHISQFPLPCFDEREQNGIAALIWQVHDLLLVCERSTQTAIELKSSAMRELFTRGLRGERQKETEIGLVPESWIEVNISSFGKIITGTTPSTKNKSYYEGGEIPFVSPGDIEYGNEITRTQKLITKEGLAVSRALPKGTTCVVCIGSTIGKVGRTHADVSATNQQINSIIPNSNFDASYLTHLFTFHSDLVRKSASPSPVPILSKGAFERISLFTSVDISEQKEISAILDAIHLKLELHRRKRTVLEELFKSLLHKLMTGEIRVDELDLSSLKGTMAEEGVSA